MAKRQRKRRVPKWMVIVSLGVLGCVLALLLTLLYVLYWMQTPVPIPDARKLVREAPDFYVICRPDLKREATRQWVQGCLNAALKRAPSVARKAAIFALKPERASQTPMQFVLSGDVRASGIGPWVAALSLGRHRGAFWFAERELFRRARQGRIPYGLYKHGDTRFYEMTRSGEGGPPAIGLWRATAITSDELQAVGVVYDRLDSDRHSRRAQPQDDADATPFTVPEGKFGVLFARRPEKVLPALIELGGGDPSGFGTSAAGLDKLSGTLRVDEDRLLHIEAEFSCRDAQAAELAAERLKSVLQDMKRSGAIDALAASASGKTLEVHIRWRAPWANEE